MSNLPSSSASERSKILSAIGPATSPPCPEAPCTITATTYFGWSYGAKHANHATFSSCPRSVACSCTCLPRYHPIFQTCSAACAAIFINDLPKALANQFDVLRGDFLAQSPIARAAAALLDFLVHPTPESRLASKLYRSDVGNSRCRHLRLPRRPLPIARAKQACSPDRLKHWRFALVTTFSWGW